MKVKAGTLKIAFVIFAATAVVLGCVYAIATGPENLGQYPDASTSPYCLPYPAGQTWLCVQSNRGVVSHRGGEQFAYDFAMPVGSDVCAARAGEVVTVVADRDGNGYRWPNNKVVVRHEDGTTAAYLHIRKDGARVGVGDKVAQGQVIAASGNVGNSMLPHLHFHVTDPEGKGTMPISFSDVKGDRGIPRMFKWYKSANAR